MKLFHWWSAALENYARGHIVVMAHDVEKARQKVRDTHMRSLREQRDWLFRDDGSIDPDHQEEVDAWVSKIEADIAIEPTSRDVLYIRGSE